ncbi:uncharacterized protein KY384_001743 [Bacidia gigantensis]|uniref:uncharacterized protein n=1 Tax=Bacidia gigantensis TaxID=2732470 RepID=UPI001D048BE0|nr:uncharacterized protein KY384_001743 [Bacidia gigantensis]KAG8532962.1 hypothetical protein KY384_001743 [Bacidia gigantensis]
MKYLTIDPTKAQHPTRDHTAQLPTSLPAEAKTLHHPTKPGSENASLYFVGTATTILYLKSHQHLKVLLIEHREWEGIRIMTDPVTGTRVTNPAFDLHELPRIDLVLLSHYHADHFDQEVEASLRRDLPIISTPHAKAHLATKPDGEAFTAVYDIGFFEEMFVDVKSAGETGGRKPGIKVIGMPGKHVPSGGFLGTANDIIKAVRILIYISGDTLLCPELQEIADRYSHLGIDLLLLHLGGTTVPSPSLPLLMITMDAKQGVELIRLVKPDVAIPIHYDDYDVFLSPLSDFEKAVKEAELEKKVVILDRKDKGSREINDRVPINCNVGITIHLRFKQALITILEY